MSIRALRGSRHGTEGDRRVALTEHRHRAEVNHEGLPLQGSHCRIKRLLVLGCFIILTPIPSSTPWAGIPADSQPEQGTLRPLRALPGKTFQKTIELLGVYGFGKIGIHP